MGIYDLPGPDPYGLSSPSPSDGFSSLGGPAPMDTPGPSPYATPQDPSAYQSMMAQDPFGAPAWHGALGPEAPALASLGANPILDYSNMPASPESSDGIHFQIDPMLQQFVTDHENINDASLLSTGIPVEAGEVRAVQQAALGTMANSAAKERGQSAVDILATLQGKEDALSTERRKQLLSGSPEVPMTRPQMIAAGLLALLPILGGLASNGKQGGYEGAQVAAGGLDNYFKQLDTEKTADQARQDKLTEFDLGEQDKSLQRQTGLAEKQLSIEEQNKANDARFKQATELQQMKIDAKSAGAKQGVAGLKASQQKELSDIEDYGQTVSRARKMLEQFRGPDGKFDTSRMQKAIAGKLPGTDANQVQGLLNELVLKSAHAAAGRVNQQEVNDLAGKFGTQSLASYDSIYKRLGDELAATKQKFQTKANYYGLGPDAQPMSFSASDQSPSATTIHNPKTGEILTLVNGKWQ